MRIPRTLKARRRLVAIAIGVTAMVGPLSACGSGSSNDTADATDKPTAVATPTGSTAKPSPTASKPAQTAGSTIQVGWCTSGSSGVRAVQLLDPQTKDGEIRYFPVESPTYQSNADCNSAGTYEGSKMRSAFDRYFNRLGAQWVKTDDGSYRAGYIAYITSPTATNTTFTDLSGVGNGTANGSFGTTPKQSKGYFGHDGMLNFVEDTGNGKTLMTVHPSSGSTPAKSPDGQDVSNVTPEEYDDHLFALPNDGTIYTDDRVEIATNKGGHWVSAGDGTISYGQGNEKGTTTEPKYGKTLYPVWVDPKVPTQFIGWDGESQIFRASIKGTKVVTHDVLPNPGGTISEVTVDPTGTQAAFILTKGSNTGNTTNVELYTVSLTGGRVNQPKLVKNLMADGIPTKSYRIFEWSKVPSES
jgi:hypothetical protein